jgi:CPA2 family monovalent cation:H+ antiporter-2
MLGKPLAAAAIVLLLGYPVRVALAVSVALAQVGEFSFILAALGTSLGVLPSEANGALVAAAIVSISVNPLLYRLVDPAEAWAARRPRLWRRLTARARQPGPRPAEPVTDPRFRAVVVGYGPVGRTLVRLLRENGVEPTVVEMNLETVRRLREQGVTAVYGDAGHRDTLKEAGVGRADTLILAASGLKGAEEMVRVARELNPDVRVLARSAYLRERAELYRAGADAVFAGEGEVALAMTESVLRDLGASPDQIDRERERVRAELFGSGEPAVPAPATPEPAELAAAAPIGDGDGKPAEKPA